MDETETVLTIDCPGCGFCWSWHAPVRIMTINKDKLILEPEVRCVACERVFLLPIAEGSKG